jgi:hypothetical protein
MTAATIRLALRSITALLTAMLANSGFAVTWRMSTFFCLFCVSH